mmetsp:Transcript_66144/g.209087  ORF Transcript_66144/g.209087 Transcript_66144/m.209087 type:complete len:120 (+) Transcript_66144:751-1110(+)
MHAVGQEDVEPSRIEICEEELSWKKASVVYRTFALSSMTAQDARWSERELAKLVDRFCVSKVDTDVMWSVLGTCESSEQLQLEATTILANNQVVKNFAAELWRRSSKGKPNLDERLRRR